MRVPVYVYQDEGGCFFGETPAVPGVTFDGKKGTDEEAKKLEPSTVAGVHENIRGIWSTVAVRPVESAEAMIDQHRDEFEGRPGFWTIAEIGKVGPITKAPLSRVNLSVRADVLGRIDKAAERAGLTRSMWLVLAAQEKLARG